MYWRIYNIKVGGTNGRIYILLSLYVRNRNLFLLWCKSMHCFNASFYVCIIRRHRCRRRYNSLRRRIIPVVNSFEKLSCARLAASLMDREFIYFLIPHVYATTKFVGNLFMLIRKRPIRHPHSNIQFFWAAEI
jgi:hypothetical protein